MRRAALRFAVLAALTIAVAAAAQAQPRADGSPAVGGAVVIVNTPELPSGRSPAARSRWHELRSESSQVLGRVADRDDLEVETAIPEIGILSVELGPGGLPALKRSLAGDPRVESVHPDPQVQLRYSPNDFAFANHDAHAPNGDFGQWNLIKEGGPRAWDLSRGTGAEVAMVDSGVDGGHPDISGRIAGTAAFGTTSPTTDSVGHGTHTAGLACGDADNGFGIASMGFDCSFFIAKLAFPGPCSNVSAAITAAANRNSDVISMSLGGCDSALLPALSYAQSRGSVLVAAGDNSPNPTGSCGLLGTNDCIYPEEWLQPNGTGPNAGFDRGLVVTSAKYDGTRSSFAELTSRVSVAAFGSASNAIGGQQGILSSWPANAVDDDDSGGRTAISGDNRFSYLVGTSMATPQVAGVAALIRAVKPNMANTNVVHLIKATASHCGSYRDGIGWGIIRADQAVAAALDRDVAAPSSRVKKAKRDHGVVDLKIKGHDTSGSTGCVRLPTAGVKKVLIFASANGRPYHRIGKTRKSKVALHVNLRRGHFRFFSIAVDKAGNREAPPAGADAKA
jgi:subtilisin family serine protease